MKPEKYKEILKTLYARSQPYHDLIARSEGAGFTHDSLLVEAMDRAGSGATSRVRVLDVAFGTGHYLQVARERGAFSCGGDLSLYACRRARGADPVLPVFQSDAECLPVRNSAFDVVLCLQVMEHTPNPEKIVAEIARVLRPGGSLFLSAPNLLGSNMLTRVARSMTRRFSGEVKRLRPLPEGIVERWESAGSSAEIADLDACNRTDVFQALNLLRSNGLEIVHLDTMRHPKKYKSGRYALARALQRVPVLRYTGVNFKIVARKR